MNDHFMWVERYRPHTVAECILPESIKSTLQAIVDSGEMPNLILAGGSGIGKTTAALAICEQMNREYLFLNASEDGNIDTLRVKVRQFASTMSFGGNPKVVVFDEADYLNANSTQPALRAFIEEFAINCNFIFTCNYKNRILGALHSRTSIIDFTIPKDERISLAKEFNHRCREILDKETVAYEPKVVASIILKHFPDFRRVLNELQRYSKGGQLSEAALSVGSARIDDLLAKMRDKDMTGIRKWIAQNSETDAVRLYRSLYDVLYDQLIQAAIPDAILILAKYQHQSAFAADQEINLMACMIELVVNCEFKTEKEGV